MSTAGIDEVVQGYEGIRAAVRRVGGDPNLFIRISFLALPVIPELRITNRGLVDVNKFDFVELY
jgi:adenine deaminase